MLELASSLHELRERLDRAVSAGWRTAAGELPYFEAAAAQLEVLGLTALAGRLRAISGAASAADGLAAMALASASAHMLLARLPGDAPSEEWRPAVCPPDERPAEHLLPLARLTIEGRELWACARLRGATATDWLLLEPPALRSDRVSVPAGEEVGARPRQSPEEDDDGRPEQPAWLRQQIEGRTRWLARLPVGAAGDVQLCACPDAAWRATESDPTNHFRQALASNGLMDGMPVVGYGGPIQAKELSAAAVADYAWCDAEAARVFERHSVETAWAIAWVQKALVVPLAMLVPGDQPRLIHLVNGGEAEPIAL